jgi:hypothetical protein
MTTLRDSYVDQGDFDDVTGLSATGTTISTTSALLCFLVTALEYYFDAFFRIGLFSLFPVFWMSSAFCLALALACDPLFHIHEIPSIVGFETVSTCWSKLLLRAVQVLIISLSHAFSSNEFYFSPVVRLRPGDGAADDR